MTTIDKESIIEFGISFIKGLLMALIMMCFLWLTARPLRIDLVSHQRTETFKALSGHHPTEAALPGEGLDDPGASLRLAIHRLSCSNGRHCAQCEIARRPLLAKPF